MRWNSRGRAWGLSWQLKSLRKRVVSCSSLGIQLPSEKVFNLLKTPKTTFLEGIWIPRACNNAALFRDLNILAAKELGRAREDA